MTTTGMESEHLHEHPGSFDAQSSSKRTQLEGSVRGHCEADGEPKEQKSDIHSHLFLLMSRQFTNEPYVSKKITRCFPSFRAGRAAGMPRHVSGGSGRRVPSRPGHACQLWPSC